MGANVSGVGEELQEKVRGSSCIRLSSRLESIFHCPGLNYYKADRNYFIRSQRPQGCKCPMNKTLLVRSGSTAPFHHVSWILENTNQRSSGTLGFYRELLMRRRCEERKWKWIQCYKSIQQSFLNVSWSHSARHALFLHHINGEKSNCYTVTTTHNCNLLIKHYLMVAIFLDDSSGFTRLTASKVHTAAFQKVCSNDKYPLDLSCHRWSLILSNGNNDSWMRVSATPYVYFLHTHPLPPDATGETRDNRAGVTLSAGSQKPSRPRRVPSVTVFSSKGQSPTFKAASKDC